MGLSPDPEKRARQLANLKRGWPAAAGRHGLGNDDSPDPPASAPASGGELEVMPYAETKPPEPRAPASGAGEHRPARRRERQRQSPNGSPPAPEQAAVSSTGSSDGSEFLSDPGPAFDPERSPAAPEPEPDERELDEGWDEARIREFLTLQGEITHAVLRVGKDDDETWIHTESDLKTIAPPLTRILNRYDVTRAAAAAGDEALLAAAVARYGTRNYTKRRRMLAELRAQEPQPITGVPAPEGSVPEEHDELIDAPPAITPKGARR